jgi:hypothetical protein
VVLVVALAMLVQVHQALQVKVMLVAMAFLQAEVAEVVVVDQLDQHQQL